MAGNRINTVIFKIYLAFSFSLSYDSFHTKNKYQKGIVIMSMSFPHISYTLSYS